MRCLLYIYMYIYMIYNAYTHPTQVLAQHAARYPEMLRRHRIMLHRHCVTAAARGHRRRSRCQELVEVLQRVAGPHGVQPMRMQQLLNVLRQNATQHHA